MKTQRLGRTGLKVSEICLGTMTFGRQCDEALSFAIMDTACEAGVDFFDTADVYPVGGDASTVGRTEDIVGKWLKGRREQIVLATKCWGAMGPQPNDRGLSRKHILAAIDESLRRLQTDYIDLYQVHAPDLDTPIDETLAALDDVVRQGKVRYNGCSNFQTWMLAKALWTSDKHGLARFDCVQPRYNILFREIEHELLPLCRDQGVGVIPYNPLAGGFLTGKHMDNRASQAPSSETRFRARRPGRPHLQEALLAGGPVCRRVPPPRVLLGPQQAAGPGRDCLGAGSGRDHLANRRSHLARAAAPVAAGG